MAVLFFIVSVDMIPTKITFRLRSDEAKTLYFEARDQQISSHQLARDIVIERLSLLEIVRYLEQIAGDIAELRHSQSQLEQEIQAHRWGSIEVLSVLIANQEQVSRDHAREWVRAQFETHRRAEDDL